MEDALGDREKGERVEGARKKKRRMGGFPEEGHDGGEMRSEGEKAWSALSRRTAPKAFLMSVAMETWSVRAAARDLRL